ncbi:MAG: ChpI protein [Chloroflexi bacterium]|nr:ChpI protein [Chloroflexota bacterium]
METVKKTAVSVPKPLFEIAEQFARQRKMSRSELYSKAIAEYLAAHRQESITAALDAVYADEPSQLDEVIRQLQAASLPQEDEW